MPRNGSGTYSLYTPGNPVVTGTTISSTWANNTLTDIGTALTNSIAKDGQTTPTANLTMGGFKFTNLATGSAATDSANLGQIQGQAYLYLGSVSGTNTITATTSPVTTSYVAGQTYRFVSAGANTGAVTLNINSLGAKAVTKNGVIALVSGDIPASAAVEVVYDGTQFELLNPATIPDSSVGQSSLTAALRKLYAHINDFRLTLTTALPVTTADVTGATIVYCTPYTGNAISLYDGTNWNIRTSAEFSLALGTLTSGRPYDVFCYDNSGVPTLEFLAWTNDTTRATALAYQDGILVKSGAATRRYLGTFYTTATTTTEDSAANRYLWNYYHRVIRSMVRKESTASWTYTTATWRQANGSTSNQLNYIVGVAEDQVHAQALCTSSNASSVGSGIAIGVDTTTTPSGISTFINTATSIKTHSCIYDGIPGVGRHYLSWMEAVNAATGTETWVGSTALAGVNVSSGIQGFIMG